MEMCARTSKAGWISYFCNRARAMQMWPRGSLDSCRPPAPTCSLRPSTSPTRPCIMVAQLNGPKIRAHCTQHPGTACAATRNQHLNRPSSFGNVGVLSNQKEEEEEDSVLYLAVSFVSLWQVYQGLVRGRRHRHLRRALEGFRARGWVEMTCLGPGRAWAARTPMLARPCIGPSSVSTFTDLEG